MILIWLDGGPPQHETYDPKPDAPAEFRGPLKAISTAVPGVQVSELLPNHARLLDKVSLIRSLHHDNGDHFAAAHWMLTGYLGSNAMNMAPQYPSAGSIIARIKGAKTAGDAGLRRAASYPFGRDRAGISWCGLSAGRPIIRSMPTAIPIRTSYRVPNLTLPAGVDSRRLDGRTGLMGDSIETRRRVRRFGHCGGVRPLRARGILDGAGPAGTRGVRPAERRSAAARSLLASSVGAECACWPDGWWRPACGT